MSELWTHEKLAIVRANAGLRIATFTTWPELLAYALRAHLSAIREPCPDAPVDMAARSARVFRDLDTITCQLKDCLRDELADELAHIDLQ